MVQTLFYHELPKFGALGCVYSPPLGAFSFAAKRSEPYGISVPDTQQLAAGILIQAREALKSPVVQKSMVPCPQVWIGVIFAA
jgi:hypothetical protein